MDIRAMIMLHTSRSDRSWVNVIGASIVNRLGWKRKSPAGGLLLPRLPQNWLNNI